MIYKVFAVKDKALNSFSAPFTQATIEAGLRMFRDLVQFGDTNNIYRRSPDDYHLYCLGTYDDDTGLMENLDKPMAMQSAVELVAEMTERNDNVTQIQQ